MTRLVKALTCRNCFSSLFLQIRFGEDGLEEILEKRILYVETRAHPIHLRRYLTSGPPRI